jgi:hypothetical protein
MIDPKEKENYMTQIIIFGDINYFYGSETFSFVHKLLLIVGIFSCSAWEYIKFTTRNDR